MHHSPEEKKAPSSLSPRAPEAISRLLIPLRLFRELRALEISWELIFDKAFVMATWLAEEMGSDDAETPLPPKEAFVGEIVFEAMRVLVEEVSQGKEDISDPTPD